MTCLVIFSSKIIMLSGKDREKLKSWSQLLLYISFHQTEEIKQIDSLWYQQNYS
jgi:hypothetical protein